MSQLFENTKNTAPIVAFTLHDLTLYAWVVGLSLWGGVVSYFEKREKFSWIKFFAHLASSGFAGLMVYLGCSYAGIEGPLQGMLCGFGGYVGTNTLVRLAMRLKVIRNLLEPEKGESK